MRLKITLLVCFFIACTGTYVSAQGNYWSPIPNASIADNVFSNHYKPAIFTSFILNEAALRASVAGAPMEGTIKPSESAFSITVPNPTGGLETYKVVESPVMEQGLAIKYPMIKTYLGVSTDHPGAVMRFDLTPKGFHASILSPDRKTIYINTVDEVNGICVVFDRDGMAQVGDFECTTEDVRKYDPATTPITTSADDGLRRTYRLAVTVNGEFSQACLNGSETNDAQRKAKVMAVLTTNLNRANGIYDRDFTIRMNYVAGMDALIYLDPNNDPYLTTNTSGWNGYCQSTLTAFGSANFDIGHLIGKTAAINANGNAGCIGCVCSNSSSDYKGSGFTAHDQVQGDPLVVDYWTHEMGHQFGANHTFTHTTAGQFAGALIEPGSGSTIMGYAGITGGTDVQLHSDDYFHAKSIDQVTIAIKGANPSFCAALTATGNNTPTANAGADYIIPKSTPFMLTGSGSDANGDVLTYTWEQYDVYGTGSNTFPSSTSATGPVFRSRPYSTSATRLFPALSSILVGTNSNTWEVLPSVARDLNFRFTVRDNSPLGGANQFDAMKVTVNAASGPFQVTSPNSPLNWKVGEFQLVTWDVAGSNAGAVNCANVAIELSSDGGVSFPVVLIASTPNDGSQEIVVPNNVSSTSRIRVRGVGNIFFDISNSNFTVQAASAAEFAFNNPDAVTACSGGSLTTTLNTSSILGFSTPINLTASGNPAGSTVQFSNSTINPGNSVDVTLQGSVAAGTYNVTVTGTAGSVVKTRIITFNVITGSSPANLSSPADGATGQVQKPSFTWSAVTGATSYTVDISTNAGFTGIVSSTSGITGTSFTLSATSLSPSTQYFWRVTAVTPCGSVASASRSFTTSNCGTIASTDVPKVISSIGQPTVTSIINIPGSGIITDVDVMTLKGTHTYVSDLEVRLISPAGTSVTLFDDICANLDNFDLNLDDDAAITTIPCPPTGGVTVKPQGTLSSFNGQNANGTWTLNIKDWAADDGGQLNSWSLRICLSSGSLPVTWLDFDAKRNGEKAVLVQWSTTSELNNNYFEVQRSQNGTAFESIGKVNAATASTGVQYYLFNDLKPFSGVNYYRLKQVDKDGKFTYSSIVKVTMPNERTMFTINPNPAVNQTVFTAFAEMKKVNVRMVDATGKTLYSVYRSAIKAGETLNLPVSGMAKGYYLVIIDSDNGRFTEKLVVQ